MEVVQDEPRSNEGEDDREARREIDKPIQQSGDEEEQRAKAEQRKRIRREEDYASRATPNTAGIESSANKISVPPIATNARASGVSTR